MLIIHLILALVALLGPTDKDTPAEPTVNQPTARHSEPKKAHRPKAHRPKRPKVRMTTGQEARVILRKPWRYLPGDECSRWTYVSLDPESQTDGHAIWSMKSKARPGWYLTFEVAPSVGLDERGRCTLAKGYKKPKKIPTENSPEVSEEVGE